MSSVGISYEAVVRLRLMLGKMSERRSRSYAESGSVGFSRGPFGKNKGTRGVKIGIMDKGKSGPTLEKGHTKLIG